MDGKPTRAWLAQVGQQVRELRIRHGWDQEELAERASVGRPLVSRLENGGGSTLASLVKVVVALGATEWLTRLAPPASGPSPLELLRQERRRRPVRVRVRRKPA